MADITLVDTNSAILPTTNLQSLLQRVRCLRESHRRLLIIHNVANSGRVARGHTPGRDVLDDHTACSDGRVRTDGDARSVITDS